MASGAHPQRSVTSSNVLTRLDTVFATHGYPYEIKSDNTSFFHIPRVLFHPEIMGREIANSN